MSATRLYKRPDSSVWWYSYTGPDGKQVRRSTGTSDETLAKEIAAEEQHRNFRVKRLGERPRRTWEEAVLHWAARKEGNDNFPEDCRALRLVDSVLAGKYLDEITDEVINGLIAQRKSGALIDRLPADEQLHYRYKRGPVKPSTLNRTLAPIRTVLRLAKAAGMVDAVPNIPKADEAQRVRWLTRAEADRLLAELPEHLADMMRFTLATGLREENVIELTWNRVDLERRLVWVELPDTKNERALGVPLNNDAILVLRRQQGRHPTHVFTYRRVKGGRLLKGGTVHYEPVTSTNTKAWTKALARAHVTNFRWHDLRHTWASWHVQSGTPLQVLKELGGWKTYDCVLRYAHLAVEHLAPYADNVATKLTVIDRDENVIAQGRDQALSAA